MGHFIGCDAHKRYSVFVAMDEKGRYSREFRVGHELGEYRAFLELLPAGSPIALETTGYWYWMVDEIERAGHTPLLTDAKKAKHMMSGPNKTDKLDGRGLALLNRNGTLPTVWIADAATRDVRELARMRMALVGVQTAFKNRIHACFNRYGLRLEQESDCFGAGERRGLRKTAEQLPPQTRYSVEQQMELIEQVRRRLAEMEGQIKKVIHETREMKLLQTLPGVGKILAVVIALEIGNITRFPTAGQLLSYAGLVPRVYSSGGRTRFGHVAPDVNRTLRWAFVEAANAVARNRERWPGRAVVRLYERVRAHKAPGVAKLAVARELAQAAFWMLKKKEVYRQPSGSMVPPSSR